MSLILSTFGIIFVAELPDKTALASLVLATRFRARDVVLGAWLAFALHTVIAIVAGSLLHLLPAKPIQVASGLGFLVFAVLALRRKEEELLKEDEDVERTRRNRQFAWVASFLVIFAAEWGDLTQLATAALVARNGHPVAIALGAIAGEWTVALLAATLGSQAGRFLTPTLLNRVSAALFAAVGIVVLVAALM